MLQRILSFEIFSLEQMKNGNATIPFDWSIEKQEAFCKGIAYANTITNEGLEEIAQRMLDMTDNDKETGEHKNATPLEYLEWAIEEYKENQAEL